MNAPTPTGGMSSGSAPVDTLSQGGDTETSSQEQSGTNDMCSWSPSWPADTHLTFNPGSNKIMLTIQPPLLQTTIQDGFENLRASLLFENAFPEPNLTVLFVRKTLIAATRSLLPASVNIYNWLLLDDEYINKISHLVSGLSLKDMSLMMS